MIGAPLSACVDAQEQAAISTINFIRRVGFDEQDPDKVINVVFKYVRDGKSVELTVPLLTIVPIPYIAIDNVSINFKANITGFEEERENTQVTEAKDDSTNTTKNYRGLGWFSYRNSKTVMQSTLSTKKDSQATKNSNYCIETTIDINVQAKQESLPAGMAKVLEMLGQAISMKEV
jgi:hypothetical protein